MDFREWKYLSSTLHFQETIYDEACKFDKQKFPENFIA